jgi:hypothetical protein
MACPPIEKGYFFDYDGTKMFKPAVVSRLGAESLGDCLAEFAQVGDTAWYMGGDVTMTPVLVSDGDIDLQFLDCVSKCTAAAKCQYITFDYTTGTCSMKAAGSR